MLNVGEIGMLGRLLGDRVFESGLLFCLKHVFFFSLFSKTCIYNIYIYLTTVYMIKLGQGNMFTLYLSFSDILIKEWF